MECVEKRKNMEPGADSDDDDDETGSRCSESEDDDDDETSTMAGTFSGMSMSGTGTTYGPSSATGGVKLAPSSGMASYQVSNAGRSNGNSVAVNSAAASMTGTATTPKRSFTPPHLRSRSPSSVAPSMGDTDRSYTNGDNPDYYAASVCSENTRTNGKWAKVPAVSLPLLNHSRFNKWLTNISLRAPPAPPKKPTSRSSSRSSAPSSPSPPRTRRRTSRSRSRRMKKTIERVEAPCTLGRSTTVVLPRSRIYPGKFFVL